MKLFLMRHCEAEPARTTDFARALTNHGRQQAEERARQTREAGFIPDAIVHSPLVRAVETATFFMEQYPELPTLELSEVVDCDRYMFQVLTEMGYRAPLIVGHNPTISHLASALAGRPLRFHTSGFAAFEVDNLPPTSATLTRFMN